MMIIPILRSVLLGALIGWLAGLITGNAKRGFLRNWLVGFIGSAVGGFLAEKLSISGGQLTEFAFSVLGGCIVLFVAHLLVKK
ncbi:MAG: GlsB/YeaQ/YmgE family stress response membrane protein [Clostridia bacterium]|nr:GlsB/YeaQ/YmgE family stress response membrane protein [Clostridia bacterium]